MSVRPEQIDERAVGPPATAGPARPGSTLPPTIERERTVVSFLRQLMSGLSAYRLYPGDLEQGAFVQACQRIATAAESALAVGPLEVEIHGTSMRADDLILPADEQLDRFLTPSSIPAEV